MTNLEAKKQGLKPHNYYNGQKPILSIVSGSAQIGSPGRFLSSPLVVNVTDTNGSAFDGAPIRFTVKSGGGALQSSSVGTAATSLSALTDNAGNARMYFKLPPIKSNSSTIIVTAGRGPSAAQLVLTEASDSGTGSYISPFAPSDVIGNINGDGSETITWQDNDSQSPIYIYLLKPNGTWTVPFHFPAGTTTCNLSATMAGLIEVGNDYSPGGSTGRGFGVATIPPPGAVPFTKQYAVPQ